MGHHTNETLNGVASRGSDSTVPELKLHATGGEASRGEGTGQDTGSITEELPRGRVMCEHSQISTREDVEIALVLRRFLWRFTNRQIAQDTGFHAESVRRYLSGSTRIPATFVGAISRAYEIDPAVLLLESAEAPFRRRASRRPEVALAESLSLSLAPRVEAWIREFLNSTDVRHRESPIDRRRDDDAPLGAPAGTQ